MTTEEALWPAVEGKLGGRLSSSEREYGRQRGRVLLFLDADDDVGRPDSVADMAEDIHCLRATGFSTPDKDELSYESPTDGRWGLLRDLHAAAHGEDEPWAPVSVTRSRPIGFYVGGRPRPTAEWVRVTFDRRLSFRALVASLRTLWPELRRKGAVRQTRPLDARTVELLRFVCLTMPDASWPGRWERWNETQRAEWRFDTPRSFTTVFHRAERSLTGVRHGLDWFYDPLGNLSAEEVVALRRQGDARARALERRRYQEGLALAGYQEGLALAGKAGIRVVQQGRRGDDAGRG